MTTATKAARGRLRGRLCEQYRLAVEAKDTPSARAARAALEDVELLYEAVPETPEETPTVASLDELLVRMGPHRYIQSIERHKESGEIISVLLGWESYSTEIGKYSQSEIVNIRPVVEQCGSPAEGGPCVLPSGHNMGQADVLDNHHWESQDTRGDLAAQLRMAQEIIASAMAVQGAERADQWRGSLMQSILSRAEVPDLAPQEITEDLVRKVAAAIIKRATWPSLHWPSIVGVQHVDVAMALARAALEALRGPEDANLLGTLASLAVKAEKDKETEHE